MWPYWMMFAVFSVVAMKQVQPVLPSIQADIPFVQQILFLLRTWGPAFVLIVLMVGFRHEVGADWVTYLEHIEMVPEPLAEALVDVDPAYGLLNWIAAEFGLGVYFVNSVCAVLFAWGLVAFCRTQPLPWLAVVVAVPYLITVVAMGYTRQGVAIGMAMAGLATLEKGHTLRFLFWLAFAATFHKSAVILLPLVALVGARRRLWVLVLVGLATALLFVLLLEQSVETFRTTYLEAAYGSSGAAIRVAMNAFPAALFLMLHKRFHLASGQRIFWSWMAVAGIGFVGLLYVSPSSTAVDRLALYWIPLQLFVLSRLPTLFGQPGKANPVLIYAVVSYSAAVLFVWLVYAETAFTWLPYQFYPWVVWQQ